MATRLPRPTIPNDDTPLTGRLIGSLLRFLSSVPHIDSAQLDGLQMDGTTGVNWFHHGLARKYRGVIVVGQTYEYTPVCALSPLSVELHGRDPSKVFGLRMATGNPATVNAVVY